MKENRKLYVHLTVQTERIGSNENKRYKEAIESYDREELYEAGEAISMSKRMATAKFEELSS